MGERKMPVATFDAIRSGLPKGRELVVRPVGRDDVAGLAALYEGLSPDDRYRRFFSAYRPTAAFLEQAATVGEGRGFGLVATVEGGEGDSGEIVGEADYVLLPNGDGELAITVAHRWRGWLGPYLLGLLKTAAAANGVPNLEADVLCVNGPMLALLRARGYVTMDRPDWTVVRLLVGTSRCGPTWPGGHERARVLVEGTGGAWQGPGSERDPGRQVLVCPGPAQRRRWCPVLSGEPCALAAAADAIVVTHQPDDELWSTLLDAHRRLHPGVRVSVERGH